MKVFSKKYDFSSFASALITIIRRFPIALLFVVAFAVALIAMLWKDDYNGVLLYYLSAGVLMSLMFHLWREDEQRSRLLDIAFALAHVLLIVDALWLNSLSYSDYSPAIVAARVAVFISFSLGIFTIPFMKKRSDLESLVFTNRVIVTSLGSIALCSLLTISVLMLYQGALALFGVKLNDVTSYNIIITMLIVFMVLLCPLMICSRIPSGVEKLEGQFHASKFYRGTIRFMIFPVVMLYVAVLYVYLALIVIHWELPNGHVAWLVTLMMVGVVMTVRQLYPLIISGEADIYERWAVRWLPRLALPLIVLMTIGIVRRLSDYGLTVNRLYILTFNIWLYALCIGMIVTRARRINWVYISFAAIFLLTTAQPFNYFEIMRRMHNSKIAMATNANPPQSLPIKSASELREWLESLPDSSGIQTLDAMKELDSYGYRRDLYMLVDTDVFFRYMDIFEAPYEIAEVESTLVDVYEPFVNIPNGYSRARHYTTSFTKTDTLALLTDTIDVYLRFIDEEKKPYDSLHVQMTLDQLRENPPIEGVTSTGEKRRIHASYLKVVKRDEEITIRIEGLMFVK